MSLSCHPFVCYFLSKLFEEHFHIYITYGGLISHGVFDPGSRLMLSAFTHASRSGVSNGGPVSNA